MPSEPPCFGSEWGYIVFSKIQKAGTISNQFESCYDSNKYNFKLYRIWNIMSKISSCGGLEVELWTDNSLPSASVDQIPLGTYVVTNGHAMESHFHYLCPQVIRQEVNTIHESCPQRPSKQFVICNVWCWLKIQTIEGGQKICPP